MLSVLDSHCLHQNNVVVDFAKQGYAVFDLNSQIFGEFFSLNERALAEKIGARFSSNCWQFPSMSSQELNQRRSAFIKEVCILPEFRSLYLDLYFEALVALLGPDLVMQKTPNLSIQLPGDTSSVLPLHCDSLQGNSVYELVCWTPLSDVRASAAMWMLDRQYMSEQVEIFNGSEDSGDIDLFSHASGYGSFIELNLGQGLIFNQNLLHGNTVNSTDICRISFNCRFKNLFSPYSDKTLVNFFDIVNLSPLTEQSKELQWGI